MFIRLTVLSQVSKPVTFTLGVPNFPPPLTLVVLKIEKCDLGNVYMVETACLFCISENFIFTKKKGIWGTQNVIQCYLILKFSVKERNSTVEDMRTVQT